MERNQGLRRQNAKFRKRVIFDWILTKIIAIAFVIGCLISIVTTQSTLAEKRAELADIKSSLETVQADNIELERILDSDDIQAYMEKLAIEELNYAYPNERRFYDTSRD